ncbi:MAG: alpha/beta hydrolase [Chloroflexi bacterium]|nr:alpha/beta hydrolase [Chloroflexota bacterium]
MDTDPRLKAFLDRNAAAFAPMRDATIEAQRRAANAAVKQWGGHGPDVAGIEDRLIPIRAGAITVRFYTLYTPQGSRPFPLLVYFHGGGFWMGSIETEDAMCRTLCHRSGCLVASVEYRLAPEHKFPAAVEDGYAAAVWIAENAGGISGDPARMAVGGTSAGGNLAAVVALMALDRGTPRLSYQLLMYPVTDYAFDTPSYRENATGYLLIRDGMVSCWKDLHGLPPALVITAEYDPLRDEGEAYAARLLEAGVPAVCQRYEGAIHGGFPKEKVSLQEAAEALRSALGSQAVIGRVP